MLCDGMTLSARRLLAVAALAGAGGLATAQAVPSGAEARASRKGSTVKAKGKAKVKPRARARATKLSGGVAWAPAGALASERPPLAGLASPATGGGGAATNGGPGAGGGAGAGTGTTTGATTTPTAPDPPPQQAALGVTVDERDGYTMLLSRTALAAGAVVVQLNNVGEDPHNLRIVRTSPAGGGTTDFPDTDKQSQTTRTVTLTGGSYYLYCTLRQPTSHEAAGMHATLRVDP
jgi:plastocyanin